MKYLLILGIFAVAIAIWRHKQTPHHASRPKPPSAPKRAAVATVRCQHCGTHLPQSEATPGKQGHYCDAQHRQHVEG